MRVIVQQALRRVSGERDHVREHAPWETPMGYELLRDQHDPADHCGRHYAFPPV